MTQNADPLSGLAPKRHGKAPRIDLLIRKVGAQTLVANSDASVKPKASTFQRQTAVAVCASGTKKGHIATFVVPLRRKSYVSFR
jgi:hypothetical protein